MPLTRDQALATLGLATTPDADAAAVQCAFERLARRYPQPQFPERFRRLLEARDQLLDSGRVWREMLESRTLDLTWALTHLAQGKADPTPAPGSTEARSMLVPDATEARSRAERRKALQDMLRAGYLAEPLDTDQFREPEEFPFDLPF